MRQLNCLAALQEIGVAAQFKVEGQIDHNYTGHGQQQGKSVNSVSNRIWTKGPTQLREIR